MAGTDPLDFERRAALLDEWVRTRAEIAALEARAAGLLAERMRVMETDAARSPVHRDGIWRSMVAEYSAAGRLSKGSVEYAFTDAWALAEDFPAVREALQDGRVTIGHVREIVRCAGAVHEAIGHGTVDPGTLALYEAAALVVAEQDSPARTRAHARQVAASLAGQTVTERHSKARAERTVTIRSVGDGLALLTAVLPEHLAAGIMDRLTQMGRHLLRTHKPTRTTKAAGTARAGAGARTTAAAGAGAAAGTGRPGPLDPDLGIALLDAHEDDHALTAEDWAAVDAFRRQLDGVDGEHDEGSFLSDNDDVDDDGEDEDDGGIDEKEWTRIWEQILSADPAPLLPAESPTVEETRTLDQIRADLLADLLLTTDPAQARGTALDAITARIQVTINATTLHGDDERSAELDGHGPLHPDTARALAGRTTGWTRLFLSPTGLITHTDTYTPTEPMRRFLRARDQHCRFPGCRMPAHRCQIDHNHDHAKGGPTAIGNLSHLCLTHHTIKHPDLPDHIRWAVRQLPDGTLEWTSPLGRTHTDRPRARVLFTPNPHPGPDADPGPDPDRRSDPVLESDPARQRPDHWRPAPEREPAPF
ncbi:HNH endonuclease signature motif containing protein [Microbacterium sp. EF45047]|uniref:HNH endonuclease signature motif containing protein n=1 Tax=Microbacterium sp. EF45047 TaxID=2809708 RepID=UPI00234BBBF8|nr:HNH endonuclease signature motif containing protein [Microbacterium sp. EF45047]